MDNYEKNRTSFLVTPQVNYYYYKTVGLFYVITGFIIINTSIYILTKVLLQN